jgi:hypothetical protein
MQRLILKAVALIVLLLVILFPNEVVYNNQQCSGYLFNLVLQCKNTQ